MRKQTKKAIETKDRLREVSLSLMAEQGFEKTKIKDICQKANVSIGTFYNYFATKEDIIKELCLTGDELFLNTVAGEIEGKPFEEQMEIYIHYFAQFHAELGPDVLSMLYTPSNGEFLQMRPMQTILQKVIRTGMRENKIRGDLTEENTTRQIFTVLRGVCFEWCVNDGTFNMKRRMLRYVQLALEGLYRHGTEPAE